MATAIALGLAEHLAAYASQETRAPSKANACGPIDPNKLGSLDPAPANCEAA
jgi:hypothetical protein